MNLCIELNNTFVECAKLLRKKKIDNHHLNLFLNLKHHRNVRYQPRKKTKTAFDFNYNDSDEDENSLGEKR